MKKIKKWITATLCSTLILSCGLSSCGEGLDKNAPDYSSYTDEFITWAYAATYDGWWQTVDENEEFVRIDNSDDTPVAITTKESLQEYKDAGFNTLMINYVYPFNSAKDNWENSPTKQIMDWCAELDLKCMVWESVVRGLASTEESLINPDKADGKKFFNTQEELNGYLYSMIKDVVAHPAFFGFSILDEPSYKVFPAFGQVYAAIQNCAPGAFVNMNLLGMSTDYNSNTRAKYSPNTATLSPYDAYTDYITRYTEYTKAPYIQVDVYPMRGNDDAPTITANAIRTPQRLAEWCKERDMDLYYVMQTSGFTVGFGDAVTPICRNPNKRDMYWQTNVAMAFGVKQYSYWGYYPVVNTASEHYDETSSFLDIAGNKNDMYYWMQDIHSEMQIAAKALLQFDYQTSGAYYKGPITGSKMHISGLNKGSYTKLTAYEANTEGAFLITELYDKANDRYGYYIVNITDTFYSGASNTTLTFDGYNKVQIYDRGQISNKALKKNTLSLELGYGQGMFVIPY